MFTTSTNGVIVVDDDVLHYRLTNIHSGNYTVEIIINNNVKYIKSKKRIKCKYCKGKKCNAMILCCNKPCHFECFKQHKYKCDCNHRTAYSIPLSQSIEDTCSVCLEKCKTKTRCNHYLCRDCANRIHDTHQNRSQCPLCRKIMESISDIDRLDINVCPGTIDDRKIRITIFYYT